jgi:tRNA (guanine37-N1)-methyltransferase
VSAALRVDVVTLFPELFAGWLDAGLLGKARGGGIVEIRFTSPRDFATDKHRTVDDTPYGGGSGMVLMPGPIADALDAIAPADDGTRAYRVLLTPQGRRFGQADAHRLARRRALALVCGRYEGFDERIRSIVDEEISVGDFVLLGGEIAAMAILEATVRLVPGVLGNAASSVDESHEHGLLEYPQYTRPASWRGLDVPEVLRSGDHAAIARYRRKEALRRTLRRRPDLLSKLRLSEEDGALLEEIWREDDLPRDDP